VRAAARGKMSGEAAKAAEEDEVVVALEGKAARRVEVGVGPAAKAVVPAAMVAEARRGRGAEALQGATAV
jgi:hypothetical protein